MKFWPTIVIFILCISGCSQKEDKGSPADFGIKANREASVSYLQELIDRRPENMNNYIRLADIYYNSGELNKAMETAKDALEENSGNREVQLLLTKYYLEDKQFEKADEMFLKLDERNPGVDYRTVQARLLISKGFYDKALQVINETISKDDGNAELYYLKGIILENLADTASAFKSYQKALEMQNVKYSMVVDYLGLLAEMGKIETFIESYHKLTPALKKTPQVKLVTADVLMQQQEMDSAKAVLFSVTDKPFFGKKYLKLAKVNFEMRRYDSARYYSELSYIESKDLAAKLMAARSYDKMYNYREAENVYLEILDQDSTNVIAADELDKLRRKVRYLWELRKKEEQAKEQPKLTPLRPITPEN